MPSVEQLGHVGLYARDLDRMRAFYEQTIGLTVTDEVPEAGLVFMSARPDSEHHELLLIAQGETGKPGARLNQVSFRCASLADVHEYWELLRAESVPIEMVVSHGNAVGVYFLDPEGNTVEVYWDTGLAARQPFMQSLDFERPLHEVLELVEATARAHADTGFVSPEFQPAG